MKTDTDRLNWLIKQGPPGACDDGFGLTETLWDAAVTYVDTDGDKEASKDSACIRAAIDAAMKP